MLQIVSNPSKVSMMPVRHKILQPAAVRALKEEEEEEEEEPTPEYRNTRRHFESELTTELDVWGTLWMISQELGSTRLHIPRRYCSPVCCLFHRS